MAHKLHLRWITDEEGNRVSVIVPVEEFQELSEDLADLATAAERREEGTVEHEELVRRLQADGLL